MLFGWVRQTLYVVFMLLTVLVIQHDAKPSRQHFIDSIQKLHKWNVRAINRLEGMARTLEGQIREAKDMKANLAEKRQSMLGIDEAVRAKLEGLKKSIEDVEAAIVDRPDQRTSTMPPTTEAYIPPWWSDRDPSKEVVNIDCYEAGSPELYHGNISKTEFGLTCQDWYSKTNRLGGGNSHEDFTDGYWPSNYCRKPLNDLDDDRSSPWCVPDDGSGNPSMCGVPECIPEGPPSEELDIAIDVMLQKEPEDEKYIPGVNIPFDLVMMDTKADWNQTTHEFVASMRGDYLVTAQIDNTDNMFAVFNIMKYEPTNGHDFFIGYPPEIKDRIVVDIDQGLGFAIVYMYAGEKLYVVPDESMSLFDQRLKPGLTTRFSVYCLNQVHPMRFG